MADKTVTLSLEEIDPFWRLDAYAEGRVLTAEDVKDIQQVLNDFNDEIGENAYRRQAAREQVLREIGGEELIDLAAKADSAQSAVAVERAMAHFQAKCLEYEGKAPAPSADKLVEALDEAIKDAQRDLDDHKNDGTDVVKFLAGVIDGLKKARLIVSRRVLSEQGSG